MITLHVFLLEDFELAILVIGFQLSSVTIEIAKTTKMQNPYKIH